MTFQMNLSDQLSVPQKSQMSLYDNFFQDTNNEIPDLPLSPFDPPNLNSMPTAPSNSLENRLTPLPQSPFYLPLSPDFVTSCLNHDPAFQNESLFTPVNSSTTASSTIENRLTPLPQSPFFLPPSPDFDTSCLNHDPAFQNESLFTPVNSSTTASSTIENSLTPLPQSPSFLPPSPDFDTSCLNHDPAFQNESLFTAASSSTTVSHSIENSLTPLPQSPFQLPSPPDFDPLYTSFDPEIESFFLETGEITLPQTPQQRDDTLSLKTKTVIKNRQNLMLARIQNPSLPCAELAELPSINYKRSSTKSVLGRLKTSYLKNPEAFIKKYKDNGVLSEQNINDLFTKNRELPDLTRTKIAIINKQNLMLALIKHPTMSYEELANLPSITYQANALYQQLLHLERDYLSNSKTFVEKYKKDDILSEENFKTIFETILPKIKLQKNSAFTRKQNLMIARIQNPSLPCTELAELPSVNYGRSSVRGALSKLKAIYFKNPAAFIKKHKDNGVLSEQNINELFAKNPSTSNFRQTKIGIINRQNLMVALIKHPTMSYEELANLPSITYQANALYHQLLYLNKDYSSNSKTFVEKYKKDGILSEKNFKTIFETILPKIKLQKNSAFTRKQNLMIARIQNPSLPRAELAELPSVNYGRSTIKAALSKLKATYLKDPAAFIKKYKDDGVLSEQNINDLFRK